MSNNSFKVTAVKLQKLLAAITDRAVTKVAAVVETAGFLLQVELDPVVEAGDIMLPRFSNEHVLEAARVH